MGVAMGRACVLIAALTGCCAALGAAAPNALAACRNADTVPTARNLPAVRAALVCLHNEERRAAGVRALRRQGQLAKAARRHARHMVARRYFAHEAPSGRGPFERLRRAGYFKRGFAWNAGESIAWASGALTTPRNVIDAWLAQPSQRQTMLAPDFKHIGIGVVMGAPVRRGPHATPAVTFTVDYGWRRRARAVRRCIRRAGQKQGAATRRDARARCHGLGRS